MMRRDFITLVGGAALAWPLAARAQEPGRVYRLGALIPAGRETPAVVAFFDEMRLLGFIEGRNLDVIPGGFNVPRDRIDAMVALIVKAAPDAIISGPDRYTRAFQEATRIIPLIGMSEDMVADGLVPSLARPGGNTTGISILSPGLDGKRLELLIEAVPAGRRIGAFTDANGPSAEPDHVRTLKAAAEARGMELSVFEAATRELVLPAIARRQAPSSGHSPMARNGGGKRESEIKGLRRVKPGRRRSNSEQFRFASMTYLPLRPLPRRGGCKNITPDHFQEQPVAG
ncbi:MAG: hypothetical protein E6G78_17060 [Alphaproteobacteria bacterium]|nr:MAG: hypothetical protein E6G78_17060 [Alphaproteobacteria bacterium]